MENKKASSIKAIERVLNSEKLTNPQRETLSAFDCFNELEVQTALTQVAPHLGIHELKRFAGHSKYSNVTPRYLHADEKAIQTKVLKERGVEVKAEAPTETPLKVKACPRCKHQNSPTFRFCAMCSMPLDTKTLFDVQRQATILEEGERTVFPTNKEYEKVDELFSKLQQANPKLFNQLRQRFWETVALEILKMQTQTTKTT